MKHLISIIWLISWPVLIYVNYRVTLVALKMFEKNLTAEDKLEE
jgi:hypothetical protein